MKPLAVSWWKASTVLLPCSVTVNLCQLYGGLPRNRQAIHRIASITLPMIFLGLLIALWRVETRWMPVVVGSSLLGLGGLAALAAYSWGVFPVFRRVSEGLPNDLARWGRLEGEISDAFEQLACERHARRFATLPQLIEKAVGDQLQTFFDQLVVDLALFLDFVGGLELRGEAGFELAEANIVKARGIDMIAGDSAVGFPTHLDGAVDGPIGMLRVVDGNENLAVHHYLPE